MNLRFSGIMLLGALIGAFLAGPTAAQKPTKVAPKVVPLEIAIVDVQKILRESAASRTIRPQIAKLKQEFQVRFKKKEEELRAANQDLNRQRAILSPEAYEAQRKAFREHATAAQREVQAAQRRLDHALATAMRKVHRALQEITASYAREKGIMLILPKSGVLLMETRFDITAEILARLNKKLPALTIELAPESGGNKKGKDGKK